MPLSLTLSTAAALLMSQLAAPVPSGHAAAQATTGLRPLVMGFGSQGGIQCSVFSNRETKRLRSNGLRLGGRLGPVHLVVCQDPAGEVSGAFISPAGIIRCGVAGQYDQAGCLDFTADCLPGLSFMACPS